MGGYFTARLNLSPDSCATGRPARTFQAKPQDSWTTGINPGAVILRFAKYGAVRARSHAAGTDRNLQTACAAGAQRRRTSCKSRRCSEVAGAVVVNILYLWLLPAC